MILIDEMNKEGLMWRYGIRCKFGVFLEMTREICLQILFRGKMSAVGISCTTSLGGIIAHHDGLAMGGDARDVDVYWEGVDGTQKSQLMYVRIGRQPPVKFE